MPDSPTAATSSGGLRSQPRTPIKPLAKSGNLATPPTPSKSRSAGKSTATPLSSSSIASTARPARSPLKTNLPAQSPPTPRVKFKTPLKPRVPARSLLRSGVQPKPTGVAASKSPRTPAGLTPSVKSSRKGATPSRSTTPAPASSKRDSALGTHTSQNDSILKPAPPKILLEDPNWVEGNFEVITSDDVRFVVQDFVLFSASPVFVSAHDVAAHSESPQRRMHFTDTEIETSSVFSAFLNLATTLRMPLEPPSVWASLIRFLRKWDCVPLHDLLFLHVREGLRERHLDRLVVFTIGAYIDDVALCKDAIQAHGRSPGSVWLRRDYADALNPAEWTLQFWEQQRIPPRYMFALVRGQIRIQGSLGKTRQDFAAKLDALLVQPPPASVCD